MKRTFIIEIICFLFIVLFVYAAGTKLTDVEKFRVQIGQSPLLTSMAGLIAWFIPAIEIIISILLAWTRFRLIGLIASLSLMVVFSAYIIAITQYSTDIPCACGGLLQTMMGWTGHLIFNLGFVLLAITGIVLHTKEAQDNVTLA